jgi:hypothetical protein
MEWLDQFGKIGSYQDCEGIQPEVIALAICCLGSLFDTRVRKAKASIEICGSSNFAGLQAFSTTQLVVNSGHYEFRAQFSFVRDSQHHA